MKNKKLTASTGVIKTLFSEFHFFDPVYRVEIYVLYGEIDSFNGWRKEHGIKTKADPHAGAYCGFFEDKDKVRAHYVYFSQYGFTNVVHETNHLAYNILSDSGIRLVDSTMETYAYYQGYLAGKCRDILDDWTGNNINKQEEKSNEIS